MSFVSILVGDMYELRDETGLVIHTYPAIASVEVESSDKPVASVALEPANKQHKVFNFAALNRVVPQTAAPKTTNPLLLAALPSSGSVLYTFGTSSHGHMRMNSINYPEDAKKRCRTPGEGRSFEIRKVPIATTHATSKLLLSVATTASSDITIWQDFQEFLRLNNGFEDPDLFLLLFCVDMVIQGIKPSSAKTYLAAILRSAKRSELPIHGPHTSDATRILNYLDSEEEAEHARDISLAEAESIIKSMSGPSQATVWFMVLCGARVKDLSRLKRHQIRLQADGRIAINFNYTKNHKTNLERYTVIVPVDLEMPASVVTVLQKRPEEYLFTLTVDAVNAAIHAAQGPMVPVEGERQRVTSYSFRRRFVQEVIAQNTNELGFTNWIESAKLTAHKSINVLRNRYTKVFQNTL